MKKLITLFSFLIIAHSVWACSCHYAGSILQVYPRTDIIIHGKITDKRIVPLTHTIQAFKQSKITSQSGQSKAKDILITQIKVDVIENFKGVETAKKVTIFTPVLGASCGYTHFEVGQPFIIYANRKSDLFHFFAKEAKGLEIPHTFWTNACMRTAPYSQLEVNTLLKIKRARETKYYTDFDQKSWSAAIDYCEEIGIGIPYKYSQNLMLAKRLNEFLEVINSDYYINVGFYLTLDSIQTIQFDYSDYTTNTLQYKDSPISIITTKGSDPETFIATFRKNIHQSWKLVYSEATQTVSTTEYTDDVKEGHFQEFDLEGNLMKMGNYIQINKNSRDTVIEFDPVRKCNVKIVKLRTKTAIKKGVWKEYDRSGNVIQKKKF